ncbi:MAG: hypothetical protein ACE5HG_03265 [Candidatus Bathyarchaeia archaeon]
MMEIGTVYVLMGIAVVFGVTHVHLIQRYSKTKDKPSLYFGITALFFVMPAVFGILIATATTVNNLPLATLFYQASTTFGILAYVFLNMFAIAMAKPGEKTRGIWIAVICFLVVSFIVWTFNPVAEGVIGGTMEFTLTSTYKAPYGLPLIETIIALMAVMVIYPIYLFLRITKDTKERIIKIKSLLMGIGLFIATNAYAIEVTDAISYQYMPIYRPMIFVGIFILAFSYMMPKWIERKLVGQALVSEERVRSFVEEFFLYPIAPTVRTQLHTFSKTLGLNHQQMAGRRILLEFDPESHYEKAIQDFATEALANVEPIVVFTRRGSAIHSSLREQKAVKFFCLTQQVSVPKEFSENGILLPSNNTSLMLDVFDKTLKAHPQGVINVVFDSLSDLVLSVGFEKTYRFMTYAVEILASTGNTVLFLLNQNAHDPKVASSLKILFSDQISFGKEEIQTVKLSKAEVGMVETEEHRLKGG